LHEFARKKGRQKNRIANGHGLSTTQWMKAVERIKDADGTILQELQIVYDSVSGPT